MTGGEAVAAIDGRSSPMTGGPRPAYKAFWGLPAARRRGTAPAGHQPRPHRLARHRVRRGRTPTRARSFGAHGMPRPCGRSMTRSSTSSADSRPAGCAATTHSSSEVLWTVALPAAAHTIHGPDPGLVVDPRPGRAGSTRRGPAPPAAAPGDRPQDRWPDHMVDTGHADRHVRQIVPDLQTWVSLTGLAVVETSAIPDGTGCHYSVRGFNALTGEPTFAVDGRRCRHGRRGGLRTAPRPDRRGRLAGRLRTRARMTRC